MDAYVITRNAITNMKENAAGKENETGKKSVIGNVKERWNVGIEMMDVDARKHDQFLLHRQDRLVRLLTTADVIKNI